MRTRAFLVLAAALLVLTACSREAGPTAKGPTDPGPGALAVKLEALRADDCHTAPTEVRPPSCEKFVTQLANVGGTARKYATGHPRLGEAADELDAAVRAYRGNRCTAGGDADVCAATLIDLSTALTDVHTELSALPDVATRSS
ncbi:hypothetical protein [Saccharomonospora piscinae]|uniref:hypothetical protein n=1 Tax=Saccharomonospora piscinae TaxID=687388 RepID=UPI00046761C2|nr:hypothetical protein [Saccharomonospora piscinae]